jgi:hypothetical protein
MARADAFFQVLQPFQGPGRRAFSLNCLAAEQWPLLTETRNVVRIDLDTAETEPRSQAVTLAWRYGTADTLLQDWSVGSAPDEEDYVAAAQVTLETELEEVQAKIAAVVAPNQPSAADLQRLADLTAELANLANWRYWQEVLNPFGDARSIGPATPPISPSACGATGDSSPTAPSRFFYIAASPTRRKPIPACGSGSGIGAWSCARSGRSSSTATRTGANGFR